LRAIAPDGGGKRIGNRGCGYLAIFQHHIGFVKKTRSGLSNPDSLAWQMIGSGTQRFQPQSCGEDAMNGKPAFTEHHVSRGQGRVYARDYDGSGPAFVLMHGFPDNLGIYDDLIPYLTAAGRRVVAFDFLGFGASDKPDGASYSFEQQLGDLEAVVQTLGLGKFVLVAHDSSGIAGINFAVEHPYKVASMCILNSAYDNSPLNVWPEMIVLFADPALKALALATAQSPAQFRWLLDWQRVEFEKLMPADQVSHFEHSIGPLIADNFVRQPSSGPAFMQMGAQFYEELKRNTGRLALVEALDLPVKVIWGEFDPYLGVAMGQERAAHFKNGSFHAVPAGHWLQSDMPERVAELMLS
jgi:haloalkane dehalogenase